MLPGSGGKPTVILELFQLGKSLAEVMASCDPTLRSDKQSPKPRSPKYPLEVTVVEANPRPSDSRPLPPTTGGKRKRQRSAREDTAQEAAPGAQDAWVVERLCGLKMKLKKRRLSSVRPEQHEAFTRLLEDPVIKDFLAWDKNLVISDKYLLSMVVAYFSRAGLYSWQYQRIHFFLALYLALDMAENYHAPKQAILPFLYGKDHLSQRPAFHKLRFQFFRSMGYRAWVSREECEEIQAFDPELWVWRRDRALILETTEAKIAQPRRDASSQQEDSRHNANDRHEEGNREPPVQNPGCSRTSSSHHAVLRGARSGVRWTTGHQGVF